MVSPFPYLLSKTKMLEGHVVGGNSYKVFSLENIPLFWRKLWDSFTMIIFPLLPKPEKDFSYIFNMEIWYDL